MPSVECRTHILVSAVADEFAGWWRPLRSHPVGAVAQCLSRADAVTVARRRAASGGFARVLGVGSPWDAIACGRGARRRALAVVRSVLGGLCRYPLIRDMHPTPQAVLWGSSISAAVIRCSHGAPPKEAVCLLELH